MRPDDDKEPRARAVLHAHGMHCHGCERIVRASVEKLDGVARVAADYPTETVVVDYDLARVAEAQIAATIERLGYRIFTPDNPRPQRSLLRRASAGVASVAALVALIWADTRWIGDAGAPDVGRHLSLPLLFVLGLLTGFHCVGMCGGFVVGYVATDARLGRSPLPSHFFYAAGKTLSYAGLGALFGWLGAFVAFTPTLRGGAGIAAGLFLIVFGLNMLGLLRRLRRFRLGLPRPVAALVEREAHAPHWPFVIGLLNGLMIACGPLQAMYVMAAGTGSAAEGGKMLLAFGLGTLPALTAFGAVASVFSSTLTHRLLRLSGVIVVALGAVMINRGLVLTGWGYDFASLMRTPPLPMTATLAEATQYIETHVTKSGYSTPRVALRKGVPVRWVILGDEITQCNRRIVVPSLGREIEVTPGAQIVEFTPKEAGAIAFSCWMGMLHGALEVVDAAEPAPAPAPAPAPSVAQTDAPLRDHVVAPGETLSRIAAKRLGASRRWRDILPLNPGADRKLRPGQILHLPEH